MTTTTNLGGLEVSALGFGAMAVSSIYGDIDDDSARATVNACIDAGITFLDTADVYGRPREGVEGPAGTNEEMLAPLLADRREEVQLATKFGITAIRTGEAGRAKRTNGHPDYVRSACEASLRRLGVETIDLYYLHRPDPEVPIAETVGAMAELVDQGKVRRLGLSEVTAEELRTAHATHPIAAVQSEWSLWSRDVEARVLPACAELGIGFVPYSPLGRGFLTGTLTRDDVSGDFRGQTERMGEGWDDNQRALAIVGEVAAEAGATNAQVALAWLLARGGELGVPTVPIPGSRRAERMVENLGCVDVRLSTDQLTRLDRVAGIVRGDRNITADPKWISSGRE